MRRITTKSLVAVAGFLALSLGVGQSQVYSVLKSFPSLSSYDYTNSDGANPMAGLSLSGGILYGTASTGGDGGGIYGSGTIFKLNTDGTGFTVLKTFPGAPGGSNYDGTVPQADLLIDGNAIYGLTSNGGLNQHGTIFRINTDGTDFTVLKQGTISDGSGYFSGLISDGTFLYGVSFGGGDFGNGTVFKMNTNGSDYSIIKSFPTATTNGFGIFTNSDGISPESVLTLSDGFLYGTTVQGGSSGHGTVFKVDTNGNNFAVLKSFPEWSSVPPRTNSEGASPLAGLVVNSNVLYGTAELGGNFGRGTVFSLNTDGSNFTVLKHFAITDGSAPFAGLVMNGNTLYGTTQSGGSATNGVIFKLHTDSSVFAVLKEFPTSIGFTNNDGLRPQANLVFSGGILYGTTRFGGSAAKGTIFKLDLRSSLDWQTIGNQLVLRWTNSDFSLQSAPSVSGAFTDIIGATSPYTNDSTSSQQFFRLISN